MIFLPQSLTDAWLLDDIQGGDLTTQSLGIGAQMGHITFFHRQGGCVSGIAAARQMFTSLGVSVTASVSDGEPVVAGQPLLCASGSAAALHQGWKAVQNVLEWSCGVSGYLARMLELLRQRHPDGHIACTRKMIPGTKLLATQAVQAAGGLIHRAGCSETILLFANHRRFLPNANDWPAMVNQLRRHAPERKIVVEADTPDEALAALFAAPDGLQLDKFTPAQAANIARLAPTLAPACTLALTGGITLFVTSAPYFAPPADIKGRLEPDSPHQ